MKEHQDDMDQSSHQAQGHGDAEPRFQRTNAARE